VLLAAIAAAVRVRMATAPRAERGILYGLETGVWRLLGNRPRMLDTARRAARELSSARVSPDGPVDPGLDAASALAASQAATSLLFADDLDGARGAFDLLDTIAAENRWGQYANVAACGRAMIDVLDGRIVDARRELSAVQADAWPSAWLNGYGGALRNVAQAWVHLDAGQADAALAELALLAPHFETIEYWEFIAAAQALAEAMRGRADQAEAGLELLAGRRIGSTTLPSVQRRLMASRSMLQLATGQARDWPERRVSGRASSVASAMQAVAAAARGQDSEALALLASAESDTVSPLQQALVAVAGVSVAQRTTSTLRSAPFGIRLAALAAANGLHWPVTLIADRDREQLLAAVGDSAGPATVETLSAMFRTVPAIVDEQLWSTTSVPALTPRERDVLRLLARTENRNEIAAELYVSINTIKAQMRTLYSKLGARTRDEALHRALSSGLLVDLGVTTDEPEDAAGTE
jgi:LuxR family maltose regulon positive regulatory protein